MGAALADATTDWTGLRFRAAAGRIARSLAILACEAGGEARGALVDQIAVVGHAPPRLLVCVPKSDPAHDALLTASAASLSVLGEADAALAQRFMHPRGDRHLTGPWRRAPDRPPQYLDAAASFVGQVRQRMDAGACSVLVLDVAVQAVGEAEPLILHAGTLRRLGAA